MKECKDCGKELDSYHFTNDEDICDYCWAMRGGIKCWLQVFG